MSEEQVVTVGEYTESVAEEQRGNIYHRIVAIMKDMGAIGKGGVTTFGEKYEYHRIDDIDDRLRESLIKHGVCVIIGDIRDKKIEFYVDSTRNGKLTWYAECTVEIILINADNPSEKVSIFGWGQGIDYSDKATGKAISYAAKAAYLSAFHLRGQPDTEANAYQVDGRGIGKWKPKQDDSGVEITAGQQKAIDDIMSAKSINELNAIGNRLAGEEDEIRKATAVRKAWSESSKRLGM